MALGGDGSFGLRPPFVKRSNHHRTSSADSPNFLFIRTETADFLRADSTPPGADKPAYLYVFARLLHRDGSAVTTTAVNTSYTCFVIYLFRCSGCIFASFLLLLPATVSFFTTFFVIIIHGSSSSFYNLSILPTGLHSTFFYQFKALLPIQLGDERWVERKGRNT